MLSEATASMKEDHKAEVEEETTGREEMWAGKKGKKSREMKTKRGGTQRKIGTLESTGREKENWSEMETKKEVKKIKDQGGKVGRGGGGGMNWAIGIDMYTLICIKQITNKNLLYKKKIKFKKKIKENDRNQSEIKWESINI